jgi:hypothetical protein
MRLIIISIWILIFFQVNGQTIDVTQFGAHPNSFADATLAVKKAIEAAKGQSDVILNFPTGRYDFWPDHATETNYYISNSSSESEFPVKRQRVGLFFKGLKNIRLEGNGSTFVFHGKMISWVLDSCENITLRNYTVDYERPGMSEMTVRSVSPTEVTVAVHPDSRLTIMDGKVQWYGEGWIPNPKGFFLARVNPHEDRIFYSNWGPFQASSAERIGSTGIRFKGDFSKFKADTGDVLTLRDAIRDYVGVFQNRSKNISLQNVHMNSMHGLGIVSQFCENLNYDHIYVEPAKGSGRVIASSADGMHFSGCRGQITINNCRFSGMHDDPINVHGTHLKVKEIISPTQLKLRFMHHQSYGFMAFSKGDTIAYLHAKALQIYGQGVVKSARLVSERELIVELEKPIPSQLQLDDALENITWTPALTLTNSRFERTISRGTLVTTRRKVLIENNVYYRTGMHAILIENDAMGWYESGPVSDVTIRNNQFIACGFNSAPESYAIKINPENSERVKNYYVHQNIRIENNSFKQIDSPVLSAKSTKGLFFVHNKIYKSDAAAKSKGLAAFNFIACTGVQIIGNEFHDEEPVIQLKEMGKVAINSDIKFEISDLN